MASSTDIFTLTLSKPVTPDVLDAFRAEVVRALERGVRAILIDVDQVGTLDSATIAALIVALRAARSRSAVLSLRAGRKNVLDTLRITALDQVFPIVTPLDALRETTSPIETKARARRRHVASIALGFAVLAGAAQVAIS